MEVLGEALSALSVQDARGYIEHAGYCPTTEAFTLLMSIGIPLENTKRPQPRRAPARWVQRSGRDGGGEDPTGVMPTDSNILVFKRC